MVDPMALSPGDPVRLGGYEVVGRLGTGGQGVVYLGRPVAGGPQVAIKLLHAQMLGDRNARARFVRELALLQRVAGFCTAQMLAADMVGDQPYIVSEFVPGPSLRELVQAEGPRVGADLDRLAISSVTALTAIHRAGIVHRDFKPQNVLMGPDGPRVIDFGIARALDAGATVTSQIVGTPAYMAPEQFTATGIGPAADLFAWAATLLFAATGRDPFAGGPLPAVMYRIMNETPDLSALPPQIAEVAAACVAKDPKSRPTAEETLLWLLGERSPSSSGQRLPSGGTRPQGGGHSGGQGWAAPHQSGPPGGTGARGTGAPLPATESWSGPPGSPSRGTPVPPIAPVPSGHLGARAEPTYHDPGAQQPPYGTPQQGQQQYYDAAAEARTRGEAQWSPTEVSPQSRRPEPGPMPGPTRDPQRAGAPLKGRRRLRKTPALVIGLVLAALLAASDVTGVAAVVADPALSDGTVGRQLLLVGACLAVLAVVTLVGVVLGMRGGRAAVWTVLTVRVARVAMWGLWGAWSGLVVDPTVLVMHIAATALVVLLLVVGMREPAPHTLGRAS